MLQFSLRNLLIAVAAVALGMAALLNANSWWSSLLWGATLATLLFAGLATLLRREALRAFWGGVLLAGGLYLLLLMYSVQHSSASIFATAASPVVVSYSPLSQEQLVTTRLTHRGYTLLPAAKTMQYLPPATTTGAGTLAPGELGSFGGGMGGASVMPGLPGMPSGTGNVPASGGLGGGGGGFGSTGVAFLPNPSYVDMNSFIEVGQALWTLLIAWLGGLASARLYCTQQPKN